MSAAVPMTAIELKTVREALRSRLFELDRIRTTCDSCMHFAIAPRCAHFDDEVPEDFRNAPDSCAEWRFDGVPF